MAQFDELMGMFGSQGAVPPETDALSDPALMESAEEIGRFIMANPHHPQVQQLLQQMDRLMGVQGGPPRDPREGPGPQAPMHPMGGMPPAAAAPSPLDQGDMRYNSVKMRQWLEANEGHPQYSEVLDHLNKFYNTPSDMNLEAEEHFYGPDSPMFRGGRPAGPPRPQAPPRAVHPPMPGEGGPGMVAPRPRMDEQAAVDQILRMLVG